MKVTVCLPSLNPDEKLNQVVDGLIEDGFDDIVLIDDGSAPEYKKYFEAAALKSGVTLLTHEVNKGKGRALKTAFSFIMENRPDTEGVVTVDGDNQHKIKDIRACVEAMHENPDCVILGCRDFTDPNVPAKSRFGNKTTRNIFKLLCGINVTDTQTGLRAIPFKYLPLMMETDGERYEFETGMFFTLKNNDIKIVEVPIDTVYIEENATSHFNPIIDSLKIYKIIFMFIASSCLSTLIDYGVFLFLNLFIGENLPRELRLFISTFVARVISSICNFVMNRNAVFKSKRPLKAAIFKYYALCICQTGVSYGIVFLLSFLTGSGSTLEAIMKPIVDTILFFFSFRIQSTWVYK